MLKYWAIPSLWLRTVVGFVAFSQAWFITFPVVKILNKMDEMMHVKIDSPWFLVERGVSGRSDHLGDVCAYKIKSHIRTEQNKINIPTFQFLFQLEYKLLRSFTKKYFIHKFTQQKAYDRHYNTTQHKFYFFRLPSLWPRNKRHTNVYLEVLSHSTIHVKLSISYDNYAYQYGMIKSQISFVMAPPRSFVRSIPLIVPYALQFHSIVLQFPGISI